MSEAQGEVLTTVQPMKGIQGVDFKGGRSPVLHFYKSEKMYK